MPLGEFILANMKLIVQEWQDHARHVDDTDNLNLEELQDHAVELLTVIAKDLASLQTTDEEITKSTGQGTSPGPHSSALDSVSSKHSQLRFEFGFSIEAMVSEYRALRASVLRLWNHSTHTKSVADLEDIIRFNESIDQAIVAAVASYSAAKEQRVRLLDMILSSGPDHAYIFSLDGRFIYANKSLATRFNIAQQEMVGKSLDDIGFSHADEVRQQIAHAISTRQQLRAEVLDEAPGRERAHFEYILTPVLNQHGLVEAIIGYSRDITERKAIEDEIWQKANYDTLTGLPNRRLFRDRLEQESKHCERTGVAMALLFIDLDNFKEANDALGHDAGDLLLLQAAERIRSCTREADTVARLGGDEFTVILTDIHDPDHVHRIAKKILQGLASPFYILQEVIHISGSIGITVCPQDGITPEQLIRNADQAMYVVKKAGRKGYRFFSREMQEAVGAHIKLMSELRQALHRRQFVIHYQPIIELSNGHVHKAEALLRWQHPQQGMLLPESFVGLAEEAGVLNKIGNWVLREAARHSRHWSTIVNAPFQVSVNQSALQFSSMPEDMNWHAYLNKFDLHSSSLSIEITEDAYVNACSSSMDKLTSLHAAGIELMIHHFGTGHAPISWLNQCNIDYLKIDQSFVHEMVCDTGCRAIAETIIVMAHKLGIKAIAEGVETPEQKHQLQAAGCDYAQGFLFSKPLPAEQFTALLAADTAA